MPYISTEKVAQKREAIKAAFPHWKFSITCDNNSSIAVAILEADIELTQEKHVQVNPHLIKQDRYGTGAAKEALEKIYSIASAGVDTEVEDGDYGRVPTFYVHLNIGKWDKPFIYNPNLKRPTTPVAAVTNTTGITATVKINEEKKGVEIYFSGRPGEDTIAKIKPYGWRWSKYNKCWYKKRDERTEAFANEFVALFNNSVPVASPEF